MKKAFLLALLVSIAGYSQDHFSGITTSKRVGILNIGLNPSELANLNNHLEIQLFSTSINVSNNKIGFSSNQFSQVYEKEEIKSFCIQNILPAKGSGGGNLEIILENQKYNFAVLTENCHFFDKYAEKMGVQYD